MTLSLPSSGSARLRSARASAFALSARRALMICFSALRVMLKCFTASSSASSRSASFNPRTPSAQVNNSIFRLVSFAVMSSAPPANGSCSSERSPLSSSALSIVGQMEGTADATAASISPSGDPMRPSDVVADITPPSTDIEIILPLGGDFDMRLQTGAQYPPE